MTAAWALVIVAVASGVGYAAPEPPVARYAPKGRPPVGGIGEGSAVSSAGATNYLYVGLRQTVGGHSAGAGATILQADPAVGVGDFHSLAEVAVESLGAQQIVELGWTIDAGVNGDLAPRVFVFHWVDGQQTCYNACGWVQVSPSKRPGMRIVPGEAHRYEIKQLGGDWWMFYDGEAMGYYPQSLWSGSFKQAVLVQWFGEVAAATTSPCTQMGNGKLGADAAAASFGDLHVFDPDGAAVHAAAIMGALTNPALYNLGRATPTGFGFGGPGAATGCCTPSSCLTAQADCGSIADPVCAGNTLDCGACPSDVCTADHRCPGGFGPRDDGEQFDATTTARGGCCDAGGPGASGAGVLGALVALAVRRRRRAPAGPRFREARGA
jgi:uncharacterized protein (TIGR03382 family)